MHAGPVDRLRLAFCTTSALIGFAGNSLLTRRALGADDIDASTFATVRIVTGATTLVAIVWLRGGDRPTGGAWISAAALAGYTVAFSWAYERIGASVGALLLFGSVQATMICWGLRAGERPRVNDWMGLALALGGLILLTAPGLTAPDLPGSTLMVLAGIAWGVYSLRGRSAADPLGTTAANFALAGAFVLLASVVTLPAAHASRRGLLLATASGSLTSGLAYTLWYAALPVLTVWRAAIVQLSVPALTAAGAVVLLDERITLRLIVSGGAIVSGVLLSIGRPPTAGRSLTPAD